MLVANMAGYIHYVYVKDFSDLQEAQPFRAFTDDELIQYSVRDGKMNLPPGNGYSGAFAYKLANGVTITVEATKSETATSDTAAFEILREVTKYVTPNSSITPKGAAKTVGQTSRCRTNQKVRMF
jgi:hypothetical protein